MSRPPRIPTRDEIADDEKADYDAIVAAGNHSLHVTRNGKRLFDWDHAELFNDYYHRLLVSPTATRGMRIIGSATRKAEYTGHKGSFSPADHELIDLVLCFDSGYWALLRIHTPSAVIAGISVETIEALRDKQEHKLDDDTRFVVQFIREVANGTLTDESWDRMEARLGTERGVMDFVYMILVLQMHMRLHHVLKIEPISPEEYSQMLDILREGPVERAMDEVLHFVSKR